ncbi:hypothetical protein HMPREF0541_01483 [Lacticaseibacillus rhamnosus ATCC 21052]|nr:hypothetical protein HMPREF0541_01483 [Lacticaseibacillus rhamnosus ATCC 21052]
MADFSRLFKPRCHDTVTKFFSAFFDVKKKPDSSGFFVLAFPVLP